MERLIFSGRPPHGGGSPSGACDEDDTTRCQGVFVGLFPSKREGRFFFSSRSLLFLPSLDRSLASAAMSAATATASLSGPAFQRGQARRVWRDGCTPSPLDVRSHRTGTWSGIYSGTAAWWRLAGRNGKQADTMRRSGAFVRGFRASARVLFIRDDADLRAGLFARGTLPARRGWKLNRREQWRGSCSAFPHEP